MEISYVDTKKEDYKWGKGFAVTALDEPIFEEDIKSIVTHQQFKAMEYRVNE